MCWNEILQFKYCCLCVMNVHINFNLLWYLYVNSIRYFEKNCRNGDQTQVVISPLFTQVLTLVPDAPNIVSAKRDTFVWNRLHTWCIDVNIHVSKSNSDLLMKSIQIKMKYKMLILWFTSLLTRLVGNIYFLAFPFRLMLCWTFGEITGMRPMTPNESNCQSHRVSETDSYRRSPSLWRTFGKRPTIMECRAIHYVFFLWHIWYMYFKNIFNCDVIWIISSINTIFSSM